MQGNLTLTILLRLLEKRKLCAAELAAEYGVSTRTVYRHVKELSAFLPLHVRRGRNGGICLSDHFKPPCEYLTEAEYAALMEGLRLVYAKRPEEAILSAKRKLAAGKKSTKQSPFASASMDEVLLFPNKDGWTQKWQVAKEGIRKKRIVHILYREGNADGRKGSSAQMEDYVEPYLLLLSGEVWRLCAFSRTKRVFMALNFDNVYGILLTTEGFSPRPINVNTWLPCTR